MLAITFNVPVISHKLNILSNRKIPENWQMYFIRLVEFVDPMSTSESEDLDFSINALRNRLAGPDSGFGSPAQ